MTDVRSAENKTVRWYKISRWDTKIEPVDVVKWTAHFVTYIERGWGKPSERRCAKDGNFFDSWEAAHEEMLRRAQDEVCRAEENVRRAKSRLGQIRVMVKAP